MSDDNIESQSDDVMDDLSAGMENATGQAKAMAEKAAKKAAQEAMKKAIGTAAVTAIKSSLITLGCALLIPMIFVAMYMVFKYGGSVENKEYSTLVEENRIEGESYEIYSGKTGSSANNGVVAYGDGNSSEEYISSSKTSSRVVLSEGNQAIENYHYYNSSKSILNNKIYIPLKGIDLEKKSLEMYNQLVKKGVIVEEGNERFIGEDSLTEVQKNWEKQYGKDGGSFEWTDTSLKNKLDKRINTGITVKGFKDKHIGKLKKIEDEEEKLQIKDEYNREVYFQLPEELLGSLNKSLYDDEFIYDEPFVQGVKYTYKKVDKKDEEKEEEGDNSKIEAQSDTNKVNNKSADNSVYTAEMFDKEFAKENGLLRGTGQLFIDYANKYDIDAALAVSIATIESGRGTSELARKNYNFFGMRAVGGGWRKFNSVEEGIEGGISYISRKYISQGITSIEAIGKIYCDPPGEWIEKISSQYKTITGRDYSGSGAGKGFGSNLTAYRGVPEYNIKLDSYGIGKSNETNKYGLGTVFMYKPTVEVQIKRGYQMDQTVSSSYGEKVQVGEDEEVAYNGKKNENVSQTVTDKDGNKVLKTIEYEVKKVDGKEVQIKRIYEQKIIYTPSVKATPIEEVDAKITYVLDKAITFAGVYEFEYGLTAEEVNGESSSSERELEGIVDGEGNALKEMNKSETRTIKIYEKPINIKNKNLSTKYMDNYLSNFKATVPKNIMKKFDVNKLVNAFKGEKGNITSGTSSESSGSTNVSASANVEKWRYLAEPIAAKYGIDPDLLLALVHNESTGNPHVGNANYKGLLAMGSDNFQEYFKNDPEYSSYTAADRQPSCPSDGPHNDAEHERVAKFHLEYGARRLTAQMGLYLQKIKGIDYRKDTISPEDLQDAIFFTCAGYQTGEYGQLVAVDFHGEETLYGNNGITYEQLFMEYLKPGGKYMYAKSPAVKRILSKYRFVNESNRTYVKKCYDHYPLYSGGIAFSDITHNEEKLKLFKPELWVKHASLGGKGENDSNSNASDTIATGTNGASMDIDKINKYMEFEESSKRSKKGTIAKNVDYDEADLIRKSAIGMIEGKAAYDVTTEKGAYWGSGYASEYFESGLPSKPLYGDEMSGKIWSSKIRETAQYSGNKDTILNFSKMYGNEVYQLIKRAISQDNKEFEVGGTGPYSFDHSGLLWYVYNYGSKINYFKKDTVEGYYEKVITTEVPNGDIRPGDVIFYTADKEKTTPDKIGIYLGQKAYLYISDEEKIVTIGEYEDLKNNQEYKIIAERRVLKYNSNTGEGTLDTDMLGQLPADLLKGDWAHPLGTASYRKSSGLGPRTHPKTGEKGKYHTGVDWALPSGNPVYAAKAGTVIISKYQYNGVTGAGHYVVVKHDDGYSTMYAHLAKKGLPVGTKVEKGQQIGISGNSGGSTGPHLHFEIVKGMPGHFGGKKAEYPAGNYIDANKIFG